MENKVGIEADVQNGPSGIDISIITCPKTLRERNRRKSDIETLASTIDDRRKHRIKVTTWERKMFLGRCLDIAKKEGGNLSRFSVKELEREVEELKEKVDRRSRASGWVDEISKLCGYWNPDRSMLRLFAAGLDYTKNSDEDEFYFRDFSFYYTELASKFRLLRIPGVFITLWLLIYYLGSAVLFCGIMKNENVCPTQSGSNHDGWVTSIYFASVTMSTVGYGDVSLYSDGQNKWITFVAILYMLGSMAIAFTVFTKAAEMTFDEISGNRLMSFFKKRITENPDVPLYRQVRCLVLIRIVELVFYFVVLNGVGVGIAKIFLVRSDEDEHQWNLMTTIYWAVQTTTTIGYGDLDMPFNLRWFNIFFTTFGTAFVGSVFGSLASLRDEIHDHQRYYAWSRRELSKMMVNELQTNDDKLDQNEFVLGSLLILNKVKSNDIKQIMDKFRELAGDKEYISISEMDQDQTTALVESTGRKGGVSKSNCDFVDFG